MKKQVLFLGIRGIPAKHGGFETFAERLALYLVNRGWEVKVYCQATGKKVVENNWKGIKLIHIPAPNDGALSSIAFDFKSALHSLKQEGVVMTFGYNTAIFSILHWLKKRITIMNMDGLEWTRQKWSLLAKVWLYINEHFGAWLNQYLIADHPEIKKHLSRYIDPKKITVIAYGTEPVPTADPDFLKAYNLVPNQYGLVIARPEPENSILEIVSGFSSRKRGYKLVVLGKYFPETNPYHKQVIDAASEEVIFAGAIYEKEIVNSLRFYSRLYLHGHTVGGTNPSLVEALAAGSPVLAHNNRFNRWVAGPGAQYFNNANDCAIALDKLLPNTEKLARMKKASIDRYEAEFSENMDLKAYEDLFIESAGLERSRNIIPSPKYKVRKRVMSISGGDR